MTAQLLTAKNFGMIAHEEGKKRIPAQDSCLLTMLDGRSIGETPTGEASTYDLMNAWCKGWDEVNSILIESNSN